MENKIRSYSIFILFLLMSISVFSKTNNSNANYHASSSNREPVQGNEGEITTIIVERLSESFDKNFVVGLILQQGGGNKITDLLGELSEDGKKIIITFKGNDGKSMAVEVNGSVLGKSFEKVSNTFKYAYSGDGLELLRFAIKNGGGSSSFTNGSGTTDIIKINFPKNIEIKTYEELNDWGGGEKTTALDSSNEEYILTKGGARSYVKEPAIYVIVPEIDAEGKKIKELKIEKLVDGIFKEKERILINEKKVVEVAGFEEGANTVRVTPINENEVEGNSKDFNFVVDTKVNDSYLEGGIIGELDSDGKIKINLSGIEELSGINRYSYTLKVGDKTEIDSIQEEEKLKKISFISPERGSITKEDGEDKIVEIQTFGFIPGSKGTLLFTIYDKLGHEKTFEKTYFIPVKSSGVTSKIEGEVKQRNSRIKIVTEGEKDKFGIDSNRVESSEDKNKK